MSNLQQRQLAPHSTRAEVGNVDTEKRTFELTWSVGAPVLRWGWDGQFLEELSMDPKHVRMGRLESGRAPFLRNHDSYDVDGTLGVIENARLANGVGTATVRFVREGVDPEADKLFQKIKDKIVRNVSVGYRTYKMEKVTGIDNKIPTLRAIDWEPNEVSVVAVGADAEAAIRSAPAHTLNPVEIVSADERKPVEPKPEETRVAPAVPPAPPAPAVDLKRIADDAARQERERAVGIRSAIRAAKLEEKFGEKLIADGTPLDQARAAVLDEMASRADKIEVGNTPVGHGIETGEADGEKWMRGATAALLSRSGILQNFDAIKAHKAPGVQRAFKNFDPTDEGGEFRSYSLLDLARESLERSGVKTRGLSASEVVGKAFTMQRGSAGASTSDFTVLLENIMYKVLLGAYAQQADSWRRFCGVDSVQDFRPSNRYRTGSFGVLDTLTEDGEFKNKAIPDGLKFQLTTETRGNIIGISRQAIINDDIGALTDTANKFGRAAGLSIEKAVYDLLNLNGGLGPNITISGNTQNLFNAAWGNLTTGAALSMTALEADRVAMAKQQDISNNEYLDLRPQVLVVPLSLEGDANAINRAKFDPTAASAFERPNIVGGLFRDVVGSPRLTGTRRYLFVDPGQVPAIVVAFLNGSQAPFMDQQLGWRVDGTEWKLRLDFKAQAFDPKGAISNAGV
jgi:hypothetical protein